MGEELLWNAVSEAVRPIAQLETQWDSDKLEKKLREYFKKGAKNLQFYGKPWQELINEYTDAVFNSVFCGLGDRDWLPEADFLFCVDAGIKDCFPAHVLARVPQQSFEQVVLQATDRAFDEQRYWAYRWETIQKVITGKMTQKKVREALDAARAETVQAAPGSVEGFVCMWVEATTRILARSTNGDPRGCLEEAAACELFHALIQEGSLPMPLVNEEGLPPAGWPVVDAAVAEAYQQYGTDEGEGMPTKGRAKGGKGKGQLGDGGFGKTGPRKTFSAWGGQDAAVAEEPPAKRWKGGKGAR